MMSPIKEFATAEKGSQFHQSNLKNYQDEERIHNKTTEFQPLLIKNVEAVKQESEKPFKDLNESVI